MCPVCEEHEDTQEHIFVCKVLQNILPLSKLSSHMTYTHMRGTTEEQTKFLQVYERYLVIREELLSSSGIDSSLPGLYTGPVLPQAAFSGQAC